MGQVLESLLALQDIELQIVDIRRQLAAKQRSVKRQAARLRAAEETFEAQREEFKRSQMQADEIDVDLKSRNVSVSKLRDNLNVVKTNKEYAAAMSQLNNEKADITRLETRAFELMEGLEAKKAGVAQQQEVVEQEAGRLANLKTQLAQSEGSFAARLEALGQQRNESSESLDGKALQQFDRISERYEGEVLARVVKTHPRRDEYQCDGCNMSLAAERANALMTREDVITCDSCGRILYIDRGL